MGYDILNMFLNVSGAFVFIALITTVLAILYRRFRIWNNQKLYKDKAEAVEPSQVEIVKRALRVVAFAWCALIIIGTIETVIQHL